ncbi:MAG TPA: VWA domain-containing protein [Gammaproteobacteria bacterium]
MARRRALSPFSLSFLDIMFCGFGAVVLLVLILDHDTVREREETFSDLRSEAVRLERERLGSRQSLERARGELDAASRRLAETEGAAALVQQRIRELELELAQHEQQTLARRADVARLSSDLQSLDAEQRRLAAEAAAAAEAGNRVRAFRGEGDRQYLTGLKLGGERILLLVDASASMLDETVVNVVRRRNMDADQRRAAPKWRRALATAEWLVSQLPPTARYQLYAFNTRAWATLPGSDGRWLDPADPAELERAVAGLQQLAPEGGTSLQRAFEAAAALSPRPDNVLLVTDGLPTQGRGRPSGTTVSADERLKHFFAARRALPERVPVNTVLLPMEGDAWAAAAYWLLATETGGSFLTPARDWP